MAVDNCILGKAAEGIVDKKLAQKLADEVREGLTEIAEDTGLKGPEAERLLAQRILDDKTRTLARKKRMASLHKRILARHDEAVAANKAKGINAAAVMEAHYSPDLRRRVSDVDDVSTRTDDIRGRYHKKMGQVLERFRSKWAGLSRNLDDLEDVMHEAHGKYGKDTGNEAAKAMGQAMREVSEYGRARYNAAGGDIPFREDWGWFQSHDPVRMGAVSKEDWINFVLPRLALDRMTNANGVVMSPRQIRAALDEIYVNTVTRGGNTAAGVAPGPNKFGSNINKRANSRFLVFRDSDAWLEYHKSFGSGNLYENIITSLDRLARDTAILEILGPYPEATLRYQEQLIDRELGEIATTATGKQAERAAQKIGTPKTKLRNLYNTTTGRTGIPANEKLSVWSGSIRAIMTSAALGGAFLSAIADIATSGLTARMAGVNPIRVWGRMAHTFALNSTADRQLAINLGFAAQGWASRAIAAQRVLGEATGARWAELMTDSVLRASWLSPWTEAGRFAFQVEMLSHISGMTGRAFDELDKPMKRVFETHGITPEMWDVIRKTEKWVDEDTGATFLRAEDISGDKFEGIEFDAANRLQGMILREMEYAVPGSNARVRAAFTAGQPAGTLWGEVMRSATMFKSFPVSIVALHWQRLFRAGEGNIGTKAEYAAWLFLGMTSMGMIGEQLTSISRGRDPEPLTSPALWLRAFIRGGSGGLLGDTLLQQGRYGVNLDQLAGPIWNLAASGANLTIGNMWQYLDDKETNAGRELSRFLEQMTPGRSTWYARLALERLIFDQLDKALDPKAQQEFSKLEKEIYKERGQRFFSRPGRGGAQRLPDFEQLFEEAPR